MADATRGRRALGFAFALLMLLYGSAVFAPLIASDLPLTMVAANERAAQRIVRTLPILVEEWQRAHDAPSLLQGDRLERGATQRGANTGVQAVRSRLDELEAALEGVQEQTVEGYRLAFEGVLSGEDRTTNLVELYGHLREDLGLDRPESTGLGVVARRSYPAFAALTSLDAFWMASFFALLAAPACWSRHRRAWGVASALLACACVGASWSLGSDAVGSGLKADMASGGIRVESALFAPVPFGFTETHLDESFLAPSFARSTRETPPDSVEVRPGEPAPDSLARHWLGTDVLGRDVLARLLHGGRLSLAVALLAALLVTSIGVALGTAAGMFGGLVDLLFLRLVEVVQSFPAFLLILAGVAFLPTDVLHPALMIAIVIGVVGWTEIARLVRAELLRLRELDLATAARALGLSPWRIAFRHLLPLALPPVLVAAAFATSGAVLTESAISFLGFGIGPPVPSWGGLIAVERDASVWWLQLFPGVFVFLTVLAFNLLGEGLRRRLRAGSEPARRALDASGGAA